MKREGRKGERERSARVRGTDKETTLDYSAQFLADWFS